MSKKVILAAGARPNFMKIAPLYRELKKSSSITPLILHTGQHNRKNMSDVFFKDLQLPPPHISFSIKGHSPSELSLFMKRELDKLFSQKPCDLLIVVGDVTSTFATALSGSKYGIPIAHVEAGLRSFDLSMPEEINRIFTDHLSDYLFTTSRYASENLKKEKIPESKIFFTGNVMIDTLISFRPQALKSDILSRFNLEKKEYALLTLHRP
ncbi:MAG: UDP-N-acetyl glucosamine 2-epimerase, partial [Elusimicrobia bacterium]|nr:UDP-N-acetyl glucosamine 2-epimerase [Elusimicrobiota bacterium]